MVQVTDDYYYDFQLNVNIPVDKNVCTERIVLVDYFLSRDGRKHFLRKLLTVSISNIRLTYINAIL